MPSLLWVYSFKNIIHSSTKHRITQQTPPLSVFPSRSSSSTATSILRAPELPLRLPQQSPDSPTPTWPRCHVPEWPPGETTQFTAAATAAATTSGQESHHGRRSTRRYPRWLTSRRRRLKFKSVFTAFILPLFPVADVGPRSRRQLLPAPTLLSRLSAMAHSELFGCATGMVCYHPILHYHLCSAVPVRVLNGPASVW